MGGEAKIIQSDDAAAVDLMLAERAHDLAMSKDPIVQVCGRHMKGVSHAFMRWMLAELARGTPLDALLPGLAQALANEIVTLHVNLTPDKKARRVGAALTAALVAKCVQIAVSSEAIAKAGIEECC